MKGDKESKKKKEMKEKKDKKEKKHKLTVCNVWCGDPLKTFVGPYILSF